jgi:hypothetical protein
MLDDNKYQKKKKLNEKDAKKETDKRTKNLE